MAQHQHDALKLINAHRSQISIAALVGGMAVGLTLIGARNRRARHAAEIGGVILILAVAVGIWIYVKK